MFRLGCRSIQSKPFLSGVRFNSTKPPPLKPNSAEIITTLREVSRRQEPLRAQTNASYDYLDLKTKASPRAVYSPIGSEVKLNPKVVGRDLKITNPTAGKIINVVNNDINAAFRALNGVVRSNNIKSDKISQRFYMKPGKAREAKTIRKNKVEFMKGFKRLMNVVKDAKRRGY